MRHYTIITKRPYNSKFMLNKFIYSALISVLLFYSCSSFHGSKNAYIGSDSTSICFKNLKKSGIKIATSTISPQILTYTVECKGFIYPSANEVVIISAPMEGTVKQHNITPGNYIEKGSILAIIENRDFLSLQEEYLVVKSQFEYNREDFKRQGELNVENATSMKIMQKSEYEFKKSEANLNSLRKRLEIIGLNPDSIYADNLKSTIKIYAPVSGYISEVAVNKGMFCTKEDALCKISGNRNPIIYLRVEEEYIYSLLTGQVIEFTVPGKQNSLCKAELMSIELLPDHENKYSIYGKILSANANFKIGTPVQALINAGEQLTIIVPYKSIISKNNNDFVIIRTSENCFKPVEIETGRTTEKGIVLMNPPNELSNSEIVTEGSQEFFKVWDELLK